MVASLSTEATSPSHIGSPKKGSASSRKGHEPPAPGRIERRLAQLGEECAVTEILVGVELREHVGLVETDERRRIGVAHEIGGPLGVGLPAGARDRPVLGHAGTVVVHVDGLAPLLRQLHRELEWEAICGGKREGVLT